jgi:RimJ/RimL family protein N-acetyltransferase
VTYYGDLVALRAREPADAAAFSAFNSDPETMRWWDRIYPPLPPDLLAQRFAAYPAPSFAEASFAVTDRATGAVIGWCGLFGASLTHRHASLAVMVGDPAYRGRGYGTDAVRTLCRFGFDGMGLARIALGVFPENTAARAVYAKAGFAEEGVQRRAEWRHGAWHDLVYMAVFPETFRR